MLAGIACALEERDRTQGHGKRVAALAEPIAERLGWDPKRIAELRFGALVHDIGKLAVRREVLCKTGTLAQGELEEIRAHPRDGVTLVAPLRAAWPALPYVLFHHERWDGSGYPAGLRGHAIPVEARLLAIADAFDAMTTQRPYRRALSIDRALAEIAACAGTQFDPDLVGLFLDVWADSMAVAV